MSVTPAVPHTSSAPRRVRHQVRDGLTVMLFSLVASVVVSLLLALLVATLTRLGR